MLSYLHFRKIALVLVWGGCTGRVGIGGLIGREIGEYIVIHNLGHRTPERLD